MGIILVIKQLSNFNPLVEKEFLNMSVYSFYTHVQILNRITNCDKKLKKILERK